MKRTILFCVLAAASLRANSVYYTVIDTSGLSGDTGFVVFDFISGGGPANSLPFRTSPPTEPDGTVTTLAVLPGNLIQYNCRNVTMAAFAAGLQGMFGANVGQDAISDETELKGAWHWLRLERPYVFPELIRCGSAARLDPHELEKRTPTWPQADGRVPHHDANNKN